MLIQVHMYIIYIYMIFFFSQKTLFTVFVLAYGQITNYVSVNISSHILPLIPTFK